MEAKADPTRIFEADDWIKWLSGPPRADSKEGVRLAMEFVLGQGVLHPDPASRPQTVHGAREVLRQAVAIYEEQRVKEEGAEHEAVGGEAVEDEAGG